MSQIKRQSLYMRIWRKKNPDKVKAINKKCYWQTHATRRQLAKLQANKLRMIIFHILDYQCVKCGFSDIRALQIDHINGDGSEDLKRFKSHQTMLRYYRDHQEEAKEKLQILCANCNWIKKSENNEVTKKSTLAQ